MTLTRTVYFIEHFLICSFFLFVYSNIEVELRNERVWKSKSNTMMQIASNYVNEMNGKVKAQSKPKNRWDQTLSVLNRNSFAIQISQNQKNFDKKSKTLLLYKKKKLYFTLTLFRPWFRPRCDSFF